ncbi:hypothetical protein IAD21_05202 [Abditibacteriota bacterium]|nr:hypothetical protein IAD21_05202 [Abditibacteriota bacterium]
MLKGLVVVPQAAGGKIFIVGLGLIAPSTCTLVGKRRNMVLSAGIVRVLVWDIIPDYCLIFISVIKLYGVGSPGNVMSGKTAQCALTRCCFIVVSTLAVPVPSYTKSLNLGVELQWSYGYCQRFPCIWKMKNGT